jgi:hypothetical protein
MVFSQFGLAERVRVFLKVFIEDGESVSIPKNIEEARLGYDAFDLDYGIRGDVHQNSSRAPEATAGVIFELDATNRRKQLELATTRLGHALLLGNDACNSIYQTEVIPAAKRRI